MSISEYLVKFQRNKPFYPLVMQYAIQLMGYRDFLLRGGYSYLNYIGPYYICPRFEVSTESIDTLPQEYEKIANEILNISGPLELISSIQPERLTLDPSELGAELYLNMHYLGDYVFLCSCSILILAHEICKDKPARDAGPLWEFLRHCRNAGGHGGKFKFDHGEPRRPAKWRSLKMVPNLQGTPLFKGSDGKGLLGAADPILLLSDIEQAYPLLS